MCRSKKKQYKKQENGVNSLKKAQMTVLSEAKLQRETKDEEIHIAF